MQLFRFSAILSLILVFLILSMLIDRVARCRWKQTRWKTFVMHRFCGWALKVLRVEVERKGDVTANFRGHFVVSNHLSYLDILILCAQFPTCFVTSVEMRDTPGIGFLTKLANCLFVERRNKERIHAEVQELTEALKNGVNVTVFPEATSTNGDQVLRFRRPLYRAAIDAQRPVLPICLNYLSIAGEALSRSNRDRVFWYDDMTFVDHLWGLAGTNPIRVSVDCMPLQNVTPGSDEARLAESSHHIVAASFQPVC